MKIMADIRQKKKFDTVVLMITDVLLEGSQLLYVGDEETIHQAFNIKGSENCAFVPKIMSRKSRSFPCSPACGADGLFRFLQRKPGREALASLPGFCMAGNAAAGGSAPQGVSQKGQQRGNILRGQVPGAKGSDGFMALTAFSAGAGGRRGARRRP